MPTETFKNISHNQETA